MPRKYSAVIGVPERSDAGEIGVGDAEQHGVELSLGPPACRCDQRATIVLEHTAGDVVDGALQADSSSLPRDVGGAGAEVGVAARAASRITA